jgi:hypothetical protein
MKKMTNDTKGNDPQQCAAPAEQLAFYFWLGAEGEVESVSEEDFEQKQKDWDGKRP